MFDNDSLWQVLLAQLQVRCKLMPQNPIYACNDPNSYYVAKL